MAIYNKNKKGSNKAQRLKKFFLIFGLFIALSSVAIPLSSVDAKYAISREQISIGVGIAKMVGIETVSNEAGSGVTYSDGVYSKTMIGGENISNFGKTTMRILCNFKENDDPTYYSGYNCKDNGWSLTSVSDKKVQKDGTNYAAMVSSTGQSSILSWMPSSSSPDNTGSNWVFHVSPVKSIISGVEVSPTITPAYTSPHAIPAVSTEIANGKSWQTISGEETYIDGFNVSVQYGITVGEFQAAGVYTGAVNYTASLKASS